MSGAQRHPQLLSPLGHEYALAGERNKAHKALDELRGEVGSLLRYEERAACFIESPALDVAVGSMAESG